jgi:hypothetical protein
LLYASGIGLALLLRVAPLLAESTPTTEATSKPAAPASTANAAAPSGESPAPTPQATAPNPHGKAAEIKDTSVDVADLPAGTLEVLIADPLEKPVAGYPVELHVLHSSVAEGDTQTSRSGVTDESGRAVFSGLGTTTDYSYRVRVTAEPALFDSAQFQMRPDMGHRQTLHVFPITRSQKDAQVVGRGVIAVHPQDDVFLIDILYQLINLSSYAWVPEDVALELPEGWKAFTSQDATSPTRFDQNDPVGAKLIGTFAPGGREVGFRFQVDNPHAESITLRLPLLPRTIEMRVIVESSPEMSLKVPDFENAFVDHMRTGERVLVAEKSYLNRRENSPESLSVMIGGMPTKGNGHIVALSIAFSIALFGFWSALKKPQETKQHTDFAPEDLSHARELLLAELVDLERARDKKVIGTKAYQHTRQVLLTSLARLTTK